LKDIEIHYNDTIRHANKFKYTQILSNTLKCTISALNYIGIHYQLKKDSNTLVSFKIHLFIIKNTLLCFNIHTCTFQIRTFQKPYIFLTYITISILYSNIFPYTSIYVETVMRPLYSTPFCLDTNTIFQNCLGSHYSTKMSMACHDIFVGFQKSSTFHKFHTSY
jgi:hypothetical protein